MAFIRVLSECQSCRHVLINHCQPSELREIGQCIWCLTYFLSVPERSGPGINKQKMSSTGLYTSWKKAVVGDIAIVTIPVALRHRQMDRCPWYSMSPMLWGLDHHRQLRRPGFVGGGARCSPLLAGRRSPKNAWARARQGRSRLQTTTFACNTAGRSECCRAQSTVSARDTRSTTFRIGGRRGPDESCCQNLHIRRKAAGVPSPSSGRSRPHCTMSRCCWVGCTKCTHRTPHLNESNLFSRLNRLRVMAYLYVESMGASLGLPRE